MLQKIKRLFLDFIPPTRPTEQLGYLLNIGSQAGLDIQKESFLVGIRGYYNRDANQRGIYDDAIFLVTPTKVYGFNANTDPAMFRRSIATLVPGVWKYCIGIHGLSKPKFLQYRALVQAATVTVTRDQLGGIFSGFFGINIHRGGYNTVSSEGCQTIHPKQWPEFIDLMEKLLKNGKTITYILKEEKYETY